MLTRSGAALPLTWVGCGRSLVTAANPHARPIIVRWGALADGVPARDLHLTRGHSLLLDGVLIPIEYLINDRSVLWDAQARVVEFFHLELEHHDMLLAEGAEAQSYREDGNHHLFHNADAPRYATHGMAPYAPVRTGRPEVDRHRLRLEQVPFELRIGSRVCNPVQLGPGRDPRDLGGALRRLVLRGEGAELVLGWDSPWLGEGFNGPEPEARSGSSPARGGLTWRRSSAG